MWACFHLLVGHVGLLLCDFPIFLPHFRFQKYLLPPISEHFEILRNKSVVLTFPDCYCRIQFSQDHWGNLCLPIGFLTSKILLQFSCSLCPYGFLHLKYFLYCHFNGFSGISRTKCLCSIHYFKLIHLKKMFIGV